MMKQRNPLVLVIDPDTTISSFLVSILESEGYRAASWPSAATAPTAVRRQQPDLVLVGKEMGNCDGMVLIEKIKAQSPHTRVILLTDAEDWPSRLDATDAGAEDLQRRQSGCGDLLESAHRLLDPDRDAVVARRWSSRAG